MHHIRCSICTVSWIYLKEQKEWIVICLHQNKCSIGHPQTSHICLKNVYSFGVLLYQCHKGSAMAMSCTSFRVNLHSTVCVKAKELLAQSRCHIWSLSDCNMIGTHNHLVCKQTLNHLAKPANGPVWLNGWVSVYKLNGCGLESCCCHLKKRPASLA